MASLDDIRDDQRATWDRFSTGWERWDPLVGDWLRPVGEVMIASVGLEPDSDVLDVASGTGEPGLTAAATVPRGRVVLTDLAPLMLRVASAKAGARGLSNVETHLGDASALPFDAAAFDAVLCRFGFMFFPDPAAAAAELCRVARPAARVSAAVWSRPEKNHWATLTMGTIARHVWIPAPPVDAPGLFRCAPDGYLSDVFARAGLVDIHQQEVSFELVHDTAEQYWAFMNDVAAPVVGALSGVDDDTREAVRREVLQAAAARSRNGRVRLLSTATVVVGTKPAVGPRP